MTGTKARPVLYMNFSGIYEESGMLMPDSVRCDFRDITGTSCYCDDEAAAVIRQRIGAYPAGGIHFLDSGNYHYLTLFWLEKLREPFQLMVLDHHTDMQPPAFGGLLSCGGWAAEAVSLLPELKHLVSVGPPAADFLQAEEKAGALAEAFPEKRLRSFLIKPSEEKGPEALLDPALPLYLSIDLDILSPAFASTGWSQGDVELPELLGILRSVLRTARSGGGLIGADICGGTDPGDEAGCRRNQSTGKAIADLISEYL